jgi:hypothetical protein
VVVSGDEGDRAVDRVGVAVDDQVVGQVDHAAAVEPTPATGRTLLGGGPARCISVAAGPVGSWSFHHLAHVPYEPFATVPALWLLTVGAAAAAAGLVAFRRRDVVVA